MPRFHKEALGRLGIACRAQEKRERVPIGIDGPIEIHPGCADFDGRLIHSPGIVAGFEVRSTALFELRSIAASPSDRWWYDPPRVHVPASSLPDCDNSTNTAGTIAHTAK